MKNKLTIKELDELVGGITHAVEYTPTPTGDDSVNYNGTYNCYCDYKNKSVTYNMNAADCCKCNCTY